MPNNNKHYGFLPFPPIECHGVIGDRRTAALVAADGTIDWLCLPDYDGDAVFGSLLDLERGGFWRIGPAIPELGKQRYLDSTAVLITEWQLPSGTLELCDAMPWPDDLRRHEESGRCIVRRVRCLSGNVDVACHFSPRPNFHSMPQVIRKESGGVSFQAGEAELFMWSSFPVEVREGTLSASLELKEGEVHWALFGSGVETPAGSVHELEALLEGTIYYWKNWCSGLTISSPERKQIERSAITVQLLTYAPAGSAVAAITSSLPERIGGNLNWDYRFAWVRDTSLSLALLALLGKGDEVGKYLDWLSHRESAIEAPLQVMYHPDGRPELKDHEEPKVGGYRASRPVRFGNRAYLQRQHGSVGYLADCTLIYLQNGGQWQDEYWDLIRRCAEYSGGIWRKPDCGIWELPHHVHWVVSKVMSWVVLDRAIKIAEIIGRAGEAKGWKPVRDEIFRDVLEHGWSESTQSFRQHYGNDEVDGALLLIPVMEFLPADDPKVAATVARIERELTFDGFVHRFHPETTPGVPSGFTVGSYEGAFFPCTFWLASTYVKAGKIDKAQAILDRCQQVAGDTGIFAEEIDVGSRSFLGNTPLLFSQVEYARARLAIAHHRSLGGTSLDSP